VYEAFVHWAAAVIVASPIRWGTTSSLYFKIASRLNCVQNQIAIANRVLIRNKFAGFIIFGGHNNIQSVSGQMLCFFAELGFAWRATGWWPDHYSIAIFDITKVRGGSRLKFTQIGIPPSRYSGHYRGWIETYWTPMKEIFATGVISDKTRRRVKIDREQRIRTGKFRRKISGEA